MTHVDPRKKRARSYLVVAVTESKARSKVFLGTGIPYDELYAFLIRRDEAPIDPKDWRPDMERVIGPVEEFSPRHKRACPHCEGRGFDKVSDGPCNSDWRAEKCRFCEGSGVRLRRVVE